MDWNGWNGMKWDRLEWTGLEWNEWLEWNGIEWNGTQRNGTEGMNGMKEWNGLEWTGRDWNGMKEWNGLEWIGMDWNEWLGWTGLDWTGMIEWKPHSRNVLPNQPVLISSSKSARRPSFFLTFWSGLRALATVLRAFFNNFHRSMPATAETETLLRRPQEPLYPKNTGFRARECFHPWIHMLPTSELLHVPSSWHDDVVDMMRREHDDKTAPGHSAVTRKFSNQTSIDKYVIKWSFVEKIRVTESERSH